MQFGLKLWGESSFNYTFRKGASSITTEKTVYYPQSNSIEDCDNSLAENLSERKFSILMVSYIIDFKESNHHFIFFIPKPYIAMKRLIHLSFVFLHLCSTCTNNPRYLFVFIEHHRCNRLQQSIGKCSTG